jgi:hypothetical protein
VKKRGKENATNTGDTEQIHQPEIQPSNAGSLVRHNERMKKAVERSVVMKRET